MNFEAMKADLNAALSQYDEQFKKDHEGCLDFGSCGFATVLIFFGRKTKLKKEFDEAGLLGMEWSSTGKKSFSVQIPSGNVPTQYEGYYRNRARVAKEVIEGYLEGTGVEVGVHSWID